MDDVKANSRKRSEEAIGKLPLEQAAAVWLETRRPFLAPRTLKDYQEYIRTLAKFFGEMRFSEIDAEQIRAYQRMRMTTAGKSISSSRPGSPRAKCRRCSSSARTVSPSLSIIASIRMS